MKQRSLEEPSPVIYQYYVLSVGGEVLHTLVYHFLASNLVVEVHGYGSSEKTNHQARVERTLTSCDFFPLRRGEKTLTLTRSLMYSGEQTSLVSLDL